MINNIKKIIKLLGRTERKRAIALLLMIFTMAFLDVLGVASIMPFMGILANPSLIETNNGLSLINDWLGCKSQNEFFVFFGTGVFALLLLSIAFKATTTYFQLKFVLLSEYGIARRLASLYLQQKYEWFLNRNSADLGKTILSEVYLVMIQGIMPMMVILAQGVVVIALLAMLLIVDTILAITVGSVLSVAYGIIYLSMSGWLTRLGEKSKNANQQRYSILGEAFGGVKIVKISGLEQAYVNRFSVPSKEYAVNQSTAQLIAQMPRFALEALAFGGMMVVVLYLISAKGSFSSALPIVALYALAGYRIMPALQQIYQSTAQLRFVEPTLDQIFNDFTELRNLKTYKKSEGRFALTSDIVIKNLNYKYPNAVNPALKDISLIIKRNAVTGIVGSSGSGKTTLIDLLVGLLPPQEGAIEVNGNSLSEMNSSLWQQSIGYVPQQIYLADASLRENIAFGVNKDEIDDELLVHASTMANLHEVIIKDMPNGYETIIGEDGVRLSGGQRQRIAIARALYKKPSVLIFDEATSALDSLTERAVMDAIKNLHGKMTILIVAHRLGTVQECNEIHLVDQGRLVASGTFESLVLSNEKFRKMASIK